MIKNSILVVVSLLCSLGLAGCGGHQAAYNSSPPMLHPMAAPGSAANPGTRPNMLENHHKLVGAVVGAGVYHHLKASAADKKANGEHLSFAERHPMVTSAAVGFATHKLLKDSGRRHQGY